MPASGLYCLRLSYKAADDNGADMVRALSIDGAVPFDECANIPLYRRWKDNGKPVVNSHWRRGAAWRCPGHGMDGLPAVRRGGHV